MTRQEVHDKYGGRCAYCGKELNGRFHVDHIVPVRRGYHDKERLKQTTTMENVNPSCSRCNLYKSVLSIEQFRDELNQQVKRARVRSLNYRLAEDFGLVQPTGRPVVFYFETMRGT